MYIYINLQQINKIALGRDRRYNSFAYKFMILLSFLICMISPNNNNLEHLLKTLRILL